jgi:hypothetical protein
MVGASANALFVDTTVQCPPTAPAVYHVPFSRMRSVSLSDGNATCAYVPGNANATIGLMAKQPMTYEQLQTWSYSASAVVGGSLAGGLVMLLCLVCKIRRMRRNASGLNENAAIF